MPLLQDVSINDVNEVVKKIGNIFKHTASVFGSKCKKSCCEKNKAENKPWFDMKCREKDRASIDVNENTVILKTKLIRLILKMQVNFIKFN
jgi:hypothetical protein